MKSGMKSLLSEPPEWIFEIPFVYAFPAFLRIRSAIVTPKISFSIRQTDPNKREQSLLRTREAEQQMETSNIDCCFFGVLPLWYAWKNRSIDLFAQLGFYMKLRNVIVHRNIDCIAQTELPKQSVIFAPWRTHTEPEKQVIRLVPRSRRTHARDPRMRHHRKPVCIPRLK